MNIRIFFLVVLIIWSSWGVAGDTAFVVPNDENDWVIVDDLFYDGTGLPAPKPLSYEKKVMSSRLGNIVIYQTTYHRECSYSEPGLFVACLRADGEIDEYDLRKMREQMRSGSTAVVGSDMARRFVYEAIDGLEPGVEVVDFDDCEGACGLRVEVRRVQR